MREDGRVGREGAEGDLHPTHQPSVQAPPRVEEPTLAGADASARRGRTGGVDSVKKHSLEEHFEDAMQHLPVFFDKPGWFTVVAYATAYERWLNNRELLSVEDRRE